MNLLARREHSRRELEQKLTRRYDDGELAEALDRLAEEGLQSDARFAASFARERALRGYGPLRITAELAQRGLSPAAAEEALRAVCEEEGIDWVGLAAAALEKKFGTASIPEDFPERARRLRYLSNRGFAVDGL